MIVAMLIAVVTLASWSPLRTGPARWVVDQFPIGLTMFLAGVFTAGPICFFIGRWGALRALRPSEPSTNRLRVDFPAILKYAAHVLARAPFAVFPLPIRGWKQARANGEGFFVSIINWLLGGALGLMVTLATAAGRHTGPDRLRKPLSLSNSSPRGHADRRAGTGAILWKDMRE